MTSFGGLSHFMGGSVEGEPHTKTARVDDLQFKMLPGSGPLSKVRSTSSLSLWHCVLTKDRL